MATKGRTLVVGMLGVLVAVFLMGQTIKTDGDVEAQGFTGDGTNLTSVDSDLLDGLDSSEFSPSTHTHTPNDVVGVDVQRHVIARDPWIAEVLYIRKGRYKAVPFPFERVSL